MFFLNYHLEITVAKGGRIFPRRVPPSLPSEAHFSLSMLMPCNDLRHTGMKEKERNLLSAQLCSAFCFCCYSNTDVEVKLTQWCLFAWQDGAIYLFKLERKSGCKDISYLYYATCEQQKSAVLMHSSAVVLQIQRNNISEGMLSSSTCLISPSIHPSYPS